ncbi:hypothetical protein BDZ97DRAFT_11979 [Flammula alnicola]|nr:hypothetical protein BDZ97DRAFT_11979 [Flammula alnicola]
MPLSDIQQAAVRQAKRLFQEAGLTLGDTDVLENDAQYIASTIVDHLPSRPSPNVEGYLYHPTPARKFTPDEKQRRENQVNRQSYIDALVDHPLGSIVEYPETGEGPNISVGHRFSVNPDDFLHPKLSIQYSLGDIHGTRQHVECRLLRNTGSGTGVSCKNEKISCKGLKICEKFSPDSHTAFHSPTADEEVFNKTLAFFCALSNKGCSFDVAIDGEDFSNIANDEENDAGWDTDSEDSENLRQPPRDCRYHGETGNFCKGKIRMYNDQYSRPFIRCQHRKSTDTAHLIIRNLDEFEISYLRALLDDDKAVIHDYETQALKLDYGPRMRCSYTASPSTQKQLCPHWHRFSDGKLRRGRLERQSGKCPATYDIYTPDDLVSCPQVLIICKDRHSHPRPFPVKTPPPLLKVFQCLLKGLDWKLADATPRKVMIDSGFVQGLRQHLGWVKPFDPSLADLHPSLGNMDHARRYINELRLDVFPKGTGFEGAQLLVEQHRLLADDEQYIRCAETHALYDGKTFYLVICMSRAMSTYLMQSEFISIDTSFKRLHHKWQEFEIETWDVNHMRSVVSTRAFTTSQSAQAHFILFTRIFNIATSDTGLPVRFRHIHGSGISVCTADAHKGQALGLGMYCQSLCVDLHAFCQYEPARRLRNLSPYDHLRRFFRLCIVHFKRHIHDLRLYISNDVRIAMLSLASSEPHPNIEKAFQLIDGGGPKARAWLKDKRTGSPFALPALYRPYSFIPVHVWKASPPSSNGNEQSHRAVYRDGVNLTILGGVMRGWQYDRRAFSSLNLHASQGIYTRDQASTHFYRFERSVGRVVAVQRRIAHQTHDLDTTQSGPGRCSAPAPAPEVSFVTDLDSLRNTHPYEEGLDDTITTDIGGPEHCFEASPRECSYQGAFQYPQSTYSTLAGALTMVPSNGQEAHTHRPAEKSYVGLNSVSGQATAYNHIARTLVAAPLPSFILYDPDVHSSSFSTLHDALLDS